MSLCLCVAALSSDDLLPILIYLVAKTVCMCLCVCLCVYVCVYVCVSLCLSVYLYVCLSVCLCVAALSSDDLLPILIYLVVKTEMPSW